MTPEQFSEKMRKLKRRAWIQFFLWMTYTLGLYAGNVWLIRTNEPWPAKRLDELTVVQGKYYIREFNNRGSTEYESGLRDFQTGKAIFSGVDALCGDKFPCVGCIGKPTTIWYDVRGGDEERKYIYQMEMDDLLVCSLEQTNRRAQEIKERNVILLPLMDAAMILFFVVISCLISWGYYRTGKMKLLGKEE